jgi:hypothetical protein
MSQWRALVNTAMNTPIQQEKIEYSKSRIINRFLKRTLCRVVGQSVSWLVNLAGSNYVAWNVLEATLRRTGLVHHSGQCPMRILPPRPAFLQPLSLSLRTRRWSYACVGICHTGSTFWYFSYVVSLQIFGLLLPPEPNTRSPRLLRWSFWFAKSWRFLSLWW